MRAGFAQTVITPPDGNCFIAGYSLGVQAEGIHDDLSATAIYLEDDHSSAIIVSFDLIGYNSDTYEALKASICQAIPVAEDRIFLTCTHTHGGPSTVTDSRNESNPQFSEAYLAFLAERTGDLAKSAMSKAREFNLGLNRAYIDENMNRWFFLNEEYRYPSRFVDLQPIAHQYGHKDQELGMLFFYPKEGDFRLFPLDQLPEGKGDYHPFGVISNYAVHPITAGRVSKLITADIPGVVRNVVEESLQCPLFYMTGATGDLHPRRPNTGFEEMRRVGGVLGSAIIQYCSNAYLVPEEELRLRGGSYSIQLNYISQEEFDDIPQAESALHNLQRVQVPKSGEAVNVEYTLLALGPVLFVGVPGEVSSELGSTLKWFSPFKRTYVMYNATPNLGYISHPNAYQWGGYEASKTELSPDSVKKLMKAIMESIDELYKV